MLRPWRVSTSSSNKSVSQSHTHTTIFLRVSRLQNEVCTNLMALYCAMLRDYLGNQRKGVLAKGVSAESSLASKESNHTPKYWAQQYIWHSKRHSQERGTFRKKNLQQQRKFLARNYLSDTPLLRAMGLFGVSTWPIGCDTPFPLFWALPRAILLFCSVAAFGRLLAEDANYASFPCLMSSECPQTNSHEIRC